PGAVATEEEVDHRRVRTMGSVVVGGEVIVVDLVVGAVGRGLLGEGGQGAHRRLALGWARAPRGLVEPVDPPALDARLVVVGSLEQLVEVGGSGSLQCSGFFEAPMPPLLHGQHSVQVPVVTAGSLATSRSIMKPTARPD